MKKGKIKETKIYKRKLLRKYTVRDLMDYEDVISKNLGSCDKFINYLTNKELNPKKYSSKIPF